LQVVEAAISVGAVRRLLDRHHSSHMICRTLDGEAVAATGLRPLRWGPAPNFSPAIVFVPPAAALVERPHCGFQLVAGNTRRLDTDFSSGAVPAS